MVIERIKVAVPNNKTLCFKGQAVMRSDWNPGILTWQLLFFYHLISSILYTTLRTRGNNTHAIVY